MVVDPTAFGQLARLANDTTDRESAFQELQRETAPDVAGGARDRDRSLIGVGGN